MIDWNDKQKLEELIKNAKSFSAVLRLLKLRPGSNHRTLMKYIKIHNIDVTHITKLSSNQSGLKRTKDNRLTGLDVCIDNSPYSDKTLKKVIKREKLLEYECAICEPSFIKYEDEIPVWNNKILVLQLDHINGKFNDNRLENLRWLCPNCHSQTDTFAGKKNKKHYNCKDCNKTLKNRDSICRVCHPLKIAYKPRKEKIKKEKILKFCKDCPKQVNNKSTRCSSCDYAFRKTQNKRLTPEFKIWLTAEVEKRSILAISKDFEVSDNAVRKWCKTLGIITKPLGYWEKVYHNKPL